MFSNLLFFCLIVSTTSILWQITPDFDFEAYEAELKAEAASEAQTSKVSRRRRSHDAPRKLCGQELTTFIIDNDLCNCESEDEDGK